MTGDDLDKPETKLIGQVMCKFKKVGGKSKVWSGTGIIIRKLTDTKYVILTCSHNFEIYDLEGVQDGEEATQLELSAAMFFLQRDGSK